MLFLCILGFFPEVQDKFENRKNNRISMDNIDSIRNLFSDCTVFASNNVYPKGKDATYIIYAVELALFIFSLWVKMPYQGETKVKKVKLLLYVEAIKAMINIILDEAFQAGRITEDDVLKMINVRVKLLLSSNMDMKAMNFNFLNLCNYELQNDIENIFMSEDLSNLPILPGSPLNLLFLPTAYKSGLVGKYLKIL